MKLLVLVLFFVFWVQWNNDIYFPIHHIFTIRSPKILETPNSNDRRPWGHSNTSPTQKRMMFGPVKMGLVDFLIQMKDRTIFCWRKQGRWVVHNHNHSSGSESKATRLRHANVVKAKNIEHKFNVKTRRKQQSLSTNIGRTYELSISSNVLALPYPSILIVLPIYNTMLNSVPKNDISARIVLIKYIWQELSRDWIQPINRQQATCKTSIINESHFLH